MNIIICLDDKNGIQFNRRRQSRDQVVCNRVLELSQGSTLWMNAYSAKLFPADKVIAYAEKKVMKLARYFEEDAEALVTFSVEKNRNKAEITVHGAGTWFRASESTSDMFASIDAAVTTIEGQIRKNKTRLARRLKQDAFVRSVQEETTFVPEQAEDDLTINRVKRFYFKPMTREEAVMQMNLLNHDFFAFRDEDNGGTFAVVYRRKDGGYGLIDDTE